MVLCMFNLLKTVCPNKIYRFVALDWYIQALWLRPWHVQRLCLFKYEASPFLCLAIMVAFLKSLLCDRYRTVCRYEILFIYVLKLPNCIYVCSAIWLLGCCCWAQAGPCFASAATCSCEGKSCSSLPSFHISSFICDPFPLSMCTSLSLLVLCFFYPCPSSMLETFPMHLYLSSCCACACLIKYLVHASCCSFCLAMAGSASERVARCREKVQKRRAVPQCPTCLPCCPFVRLL